MGSGHNDSASSLESQLASELERELRGIPVGVHFNVPASADICSSLELFLPRLLRRDHPEWTNESLDGIFVARAMKTGLTAAEFAGTCILISDQTVTPFLMDVALSATTGSIASVRLMIGEAGGGRLGISGPPCNSREARRLLEMLIDRLDKVAWTYKVEYGAKQNRL
jgi:hypothetical protein